MSKKDYRTWWRRGVEVEDEFDEISYQAEDLLKDYWLPDDVDDSIYDCQLEQFWAIAVGLTDC